MSDESNDATQPIPAETREAKKARQHKSKMVDVLEEVVEVMEAIRADGFDINFTIQQNAETKEHFINPDLIRISKSW